MLRVWRPRTSPNQGHVAERQAGPLLEPTKRDVLDQRKDVALEGGEVDELAVGLVPLSGLTLAGDVCLGAAGCRRAPVGRISAGLLRLLDRGEAGAVERMLLLLALVVG